MESFFFVPQDWVSCFYLLDFSACTFLHGVRWVTLVTGKYYEMNLNTAFCSKIADRVCAFFQTFLETFHSNRIYPMHTLNYIPCVFFEHQIVPFTTLCSQSFAFYQKYKLSCPFLQKCFIWWLLAKPCSPTTQSTFLLHEIFLTFCWFFCWRIWKI